jgi:hypothetical protein
MIRRIASSMTCWKHSFRNFGNPDLQAAEEAGATARCYSFRRMQMVQKGAVGAQSCRIRAQTGHNIQPTAVSPHFSGSSLAAGSVVYKTASHLRTVGSFCPLQPGSSTKAVRRYRLTARTTVPVG